jgi:hypothetical protein
MKKLLSIILILVVCVSALCSCGARSVKGEDKLLGQWFASIEGDTVIYTFEKEGDNVYNASCTTEYAGGGSVTYSFSSFSVSEDEKTLTLNQNDTETVMVYSVSDGSLYIDGVKFDVYTLTDGTDSDKVGFKPVNFVSNLQYMGSGMLGIFVVIGIIVAITYILNAITRKKK